MKHELFPVTNPDDIISDSFIFLHNLKTYANLLQISLNILHYYSNESLYSRRASFPRPLHLMRARLSCPQLSHDYLEYKCILKLEACLSIFRGVMYDILC